MAEIIEQFAELFQGRTDAYGSDEGGCVRIGDRPWALDILIEDHLKGYKPIGVYPLRGTASDEATRWEVKWGCIDFDEGEEESWPHAVNVRAVLEQFGITAWIERSRSKGFHVWVFVSDWVPARTMRRALLAACQVVGAPTKEINPKQEELGEGQLGNYVRLPYPGSLTSSTYGADVRRVMLEPNRKSPWRLDEFVPLALATRAKQGQLEKVADLVQKPKRSIPRRGRPKRVNEDMDSYSRLSGLAHTILKEGPKEGVDRSTTLWKLATRIHDDGSHTFEEALDIMIQADLAWGKFMERGDSGEAELTRMLEKIWDG